MTRPVKTRTFSAVAAIRGYTYRATFSLRSGRVLHIKAGCRTWRTFRQAFDHYDGAGPYKHHTHSSVKWNRRNCRIEYWRAGPRADAIATLKRLQKRIEAWRASR